MVGGHGEVMLAGDQGGVRVAQVLDEMMHVPVRRQLVETGHVVGLSLRRVRKAEMAAGLGRLDAPGSVGGGHAEPLGLAALERSRADGVDYSGAGRRAVADGGLGVGTPPPEGCQAVSRRPYGRARTGFRRSARPNCPPISISR